MECLLMCSNRTHDPIYLPDQNPVIVGRSIETKIREKKLSRKQVELTADYAKQTVLVKQFGINPSTVGAKSLSQNDTCTLGPGGKLNLLIGKYEHFIYFKKLEISSDQSEPEILKEDKLKWKRKSELMDHNAPIKRQKMEEQSPDSSPANSQLSNTVNKDELDYESLKEEFGESIIQEIRNSQDKDSQEVPCLRGDEEKKSNCKENLADFKPTTSSQWDEVESGKLLVYETEGLLPRKKVASLDLDGTIVTTKSGLVHATGLDDWKIKYSQIFQKIQTLQNEGFKIVIFTNQASIGQGKLNKEDFKIKMERIVSKLKVPLQVFVATTRGIYRKPMKGMWQYLIEEANCSLPVDKSKSFFIGDAAGRPANWAPKQKKDFSCSDRTFALNIGIRFFTPEEFFLGKTPAPFNLPEFNPRKLSTDVPLFTPPTSKLVSSDQEVTILVGFPASGKTSFVKKHLLRHGYIHVNRDTCGSWQKCVAICKAELSRKNSVVIDNTNPDKESRQRYIGPAKKAGVPVRCFVFNVSYDHAMHNNRIREITNDDKNYKSVGKMVFNAYRSSYQEPDMSEGFTEILRVNFVPNFETTWFKNLYMQYTE